MWADAVFEGGGVKAIGLVGALIVAEEKGYKWKRVAGTSAGAIIAALLAAGYRARELKEVIEQLDYSMFTAPTAWHRFPYIGPASRLILKKGLYPGKKIEKWIDGLLRRKGIKTFADLTDDTLQIVASDITRGRLLVLPRDLHLYGLTARELTIAEAVRMSCSIPYLFDPYILSSKLEPYRNYVVDGCVLSNFPVWLFDKPSPRWPTFGFRLISDDYHYPNRIYGPLSLFRALFNTMLEAHDMKQLENQDKVRTIFVPSLNVKSTEFNLEPKERAALFKSGVQAAENFFEHWDFQQYVRAYRNNNKMTLTINKT